MVLCTSFGPGHPSTNGLTERYEQILKSKLVKMNSDTIMPIQEKVQRILHLLRATPLSCGQSPSELYLHRKIRIRLEALKPVKMPKHVPVHQHTRSFQVNDRVLAGVYRNKKPSWELESIIERLGQLHYTVRLDNGYIFDRHKVEQLWNPVLQSIIHQNVLFPRHTQNK